MNAVERLQAAISKLETLKADSLIDAPLSVYEGPEWYEIRDESAAQVAPYMSGFDAELFVTLHRTIDAQLAILRRGALVATEGSLAVTLADAILREE